jgi:hypothetical protein
MLRLGPILALITAAGINLALRTTDFSVRALTSRRCANVPRLRAAATKGALKPINAGTARGDQPLFRFLSSRVSGSAPARIIG